MICPTGATVLDPIGMCAMPDGSIVAQDTGPNWVVTAPAPTPNTVPVAPPPPVSAPAVDVPYNQQGYLTPQNPNYVDLLGRTDPYLNYQGSGNVPNVQPGSNGTLPIIDTSVSWIQKYWWVGAIGIGLLLLNKGRF